MTTSELLNRGLSIGVLASKGLAHEQLQQYTVFVVHRNDPAFAKASKVPGSQPSPDGEWRVLLLKTRPNDLKVEVLICAFADSQERSFVSTYALLQGLIHAATSVAALGVTTHHVGTA